MFLLIPLYSVFSQGLTNYDVQPMLNVFGSTILDMGCRRGPDLRAQQHGPQPVYEPESRGACNWGVPEVFMDGPGNLLSGLSLLAIVSSVLQFVASRMTLPPVATTAAEDPNIRMQRQMAIFLPFISLIYGGILPAGLFLYWIVSTIFSIVQQYLILGWGGMFPIFGWTPGFAVDHQPRFPVAMPVAPTSTSRAAGAPARSTNDRSALDRSASAQATIRQRGRQGRRGRRRKMRPDMSAYREFTGKSVEEALRLAREAFGAGLDDLDFEILTPGSRGVLGMGAEPARILAAPRSELGGAAPKREAAASRPLPPPPPRDDREDRRLGSRPRPRPGGCDPTGAATATGGGPAGRPAPR